MAAAPTAHVPLGDGTLDVAGRRWIRAGAAVELTPLEAELLAYLAARPGVTVGRDELLRCVWGYRDGVRSRAVDYAVRRLRQKIEVDATNPSLLVSVYGGGYRLEVAAPPERPAAPTPPAPHPLIGRDALLQELLPALEVPGVVTLHGPGGIGKTYLAWVATSGSDQPFVDASRCGAAAELVGATAAVLGVPIAARSDITSERVGRALGALGRAVMVLDNLEQVADAAQVVGAWADLAPSATLLCTSRRPLSIDGERVLRVPPLELDAGVQLYLRHARRVGATDVDDAEVRALVSQLDGLPLAILRAASRADILGPRALLARLDDRLRYLRDRGTLGLPVRQRALQASIEASWELLEEAEQRALAWTAVFEAPFDVDAALHVVPAPPDVDPLDLIEALVDHALLERRPGSRLAPWASVRAFAVDRLRMSGEEAQARAALVRWLVDGTATATPSWSQAQQLHMIAALRRPDDLDPTDAATLARALYRQQATIPSDVLEAILETTARLPGLPPREAVALDLAVADIARVRGLLRPEEIADRLLAAQQRADQLDDGPSSRLAARLLGAFLRQRGDLAGARAHLTRSLEACRVAGDGLGEALCLDDLGLVAQRGDLEEARELHVQALGLFRAAGSRAGAARALTNLARVLRSLQRDEAEAVAREALDLHVESGHDEQAAVARANLGNLLLMRDDLDGALPLLQQSLNQHRLLGNHLGVLHTLSSLGIAALLAGHVSRGEAFFREQLAAADDREPRLTAAAWSGLACGAMLDGRYADAAARYLRAEESLARSGAAALVAANRAQRAAALAAAGEVHAARDLLEPLGHPEGELGALVALGWAHVALSEGQAASPPEIGPWLTTRLLARALRARTP